MNTFDTPTSIEVEVSISAGSVHLIASERGDTTVAVNPTDPSVKADVEAADRANAVLSGRHLTVETEKTGGIRNVVGFTRTGSVDVTIELPEDSSVDIATGAGGVRADGVFGKTRVKNGAGPVHLDVCGDCEVSTGFGDMSLSHARGDTRVKAGGVMRLERIDGTAQIKNVSFGDTHIGEVAGSLQVTSASGSISVAKARRDVHARTASGGIDIGEAVSGEITLATAAGPIGVGVGEGTAAWVDARTKFGRVLNSLEATGAPDESAGAVEIQARTSFGDIDIHRSSPSENR